LASQAASPDIAVSKPSGKQVEEDKPMEVQTSKLDSAIVCEDEHT